MGKSLKRNIKGALRTPIYDAFIKLEIKAEKNKY